MLQVGLQAFLHVATLSFWWSGNWASQVTDDIFNFLFSYLLPHFKQWPDAHVFQPLLHNHFSCLLYDALTLALELVTPIRKNTFCKYAIIWYYYKNILVLNITSYY